MSFSPLEDEEILIGTQSKSVTKASANRANRMVNDLKMLLKNAIFGLNRNISANIGQNKTNRASFIY